MLSNIQNLRQIGNLPKCKVTPEAEVPAVFLLYINTIYTIHSYHLYYKFCRYLYNIKKCNCLMLFNAMCQCRKSFITREFPQNNNFGKERKKQHITASAPGPAFAVSQNSLFQSCPYYDSSMQSYRFLLISCLCTLCAYPVATRLMHVYAERKFLYQTWL